MRLPTTGEKREGIRTKIAKQAAKHCRCDGGSSDDSAAGDCVVNLEGSGPVLHIKHTDQGTQVGREVDQSVEIGD